MQYCLHGNDYKIRQQCGYLSLCTTYITRYVLEIQFMSKVNKRMVLTKVTIATVKKGLIHEDQTYDQACISALC